MQCTSRFDAGSSTLRMPHGCQRNVRFYERSICADTMCNHRHGTQQGPQPGLGVIVLDALTRREWVQEDYVPRRREEGEAEDTKVSPWTVPRTCAPDCGASDTLLMAYAVAYVVHTCDAFVDD